MFEGKNHVHAIATAVGTLGGFQDAPGWFKSVSKTAIWQILMGTVLVFQGGGHLDFSYSLTVGILFYLFVTLSNYLSFSADESQGDEAVEEVSSPETESFVGDEEDFSVPSLGEEFAGDEEQFMGDEEQFDVINDNQNAPEKTEHFGNEPMALNQSTNTFADFSS
jgi:hypothetical protein